jgi:hypothetical protein
MAEGTSPEPEDLVDVFYVPFVRPLGNLAVLFAQAEAAWLEFAGELTGNTEKEAQRFLQMKAPDAKQEIIPLAQASGIQGFDLEELSQGIESYCCDRERRNRLMHDEWWVDVLDGGLPKTRGLPRKKDAVVVWGDSTPDDVWRLAFRFRDYKGLFPTAPTIFVSGKALPDEAKMHLLLQYRMDLREPRQSSVGWRESLRVRRAGMSCPSCNVSNADNPPRLPAGFQPIPFVS